MKRIYISGPSSGLPNDNLEAFGQAEAFLASMGFEAINPIRLGLDALGRDADYSEYMKFDLAILCTCDAIYMLKGWEHSRGAMFEKQAAQITDMEFYYQ